MALHRLTEIYKNRSVSDWISSINDLNHRMVILKNNQTNISTETLIWALTYGVVPFMILGLMYDDKMYVTKGGHEISVIQKFVQNEITIQLHTLKPSRLINYKALEREQQENIQYSIIPAVYCRVDTKQELNKLLETII